MKYYINQSTDPYFNLALEEYIFSTADDDIFMLWRNSKSVILGKNQNAYAEVDLHFTQSNNINVVRRITGGGAVFHDTGNINYTFISKKEASKEKDFKYFSFPVTEALKQLGIDTYFSGRNDLVTSDGRKFSGTARCEKNNRILHHGTLLYSADISFLSSALKVNPTKMNSKGVKSVKSRVVNISELMKEKMSPEMFMDTIKSYVIKLYQCEPLVLTNSDFEAINKLRNEKYITDKWNLSSNLPFEKTSSEYFPYGLVTVCYTVKNGLISEIRFEGDFFGTKDIAELEKILCHISYTKEAVINAISGINITDFISGAEHKHIINLIFN